MKFLFSIVVCLFALFAGVFGVRSLNSLQNGRMGGAGLTGGRANAFNKVSTLGFPHSSRQYQPSGRNLDRQAAMANRRRNLQNPPFGARRNRILANQQNNNSGGSSDTGSSGSSKDD